MVLPNVNKKGNSFLKRNRGVLWMILLTVLSLTGSGLEAQLAVRAGDADLGGSKQATHRFAGPNDVLTVSIQNDFSTSMEVTMDRPGSFSKSAYKLEEQLPLSLPTGGIQTLHFSIDYSKWIGPAKEVTLQFRPEGDPNAAPFSLVMEFTAAGKIMIWDPELRSLYDKVTFQQFNEGGDGFAERRIEVRRNGSENIFCRLELKDDPRNTFSFFWNEDRPLQDRSTFKLDSRGKSLLVRYEPPDGISRAMDRTRVTLLNVNDPDNSLSFWVVGNLLSTGEERTGPPLSSVDIPEPGSQPTNTNPVSRPSNQGDTRPQPNPNPQPDNIPDAPTDVVLNDPSNTQDPPEDPGVDMPLPEYIQNPLSPDEIRKCLSDLRKTPYRKDSTLTFFQEDEVTKASLEFDFFPLMVECGRRLNLEVEAANLVLPKSADSTANRKFQLAIDTFIYDTTGRIVFSFPPGLIDTMEARDLEDSAFSVFFDISPDLPAEVRDSVDMAEFTLVNDMKGSVFHKDWTWYWVLGSLAFALIFGFFFGRYMLSRPIPVHDLRYRTKPKRKKRLQARELVLNMDRLEVDLLQLDFKEGPLLAEVAAPPESAISPFRKFMKKMFLMGKRPDEFQFQAEYYSFRVEPRLDALRHEGLQFRSQEGLFLIGTELTGEILSTDHQDFLITKQEFRYNIFIDPSEIIAYSGPKKTFNIPFLVTEEAFEGYKKQKEYLVPLTVVPKERVRG